MTRFLLAWAAVVALYAPPLVAAPVPKALKRVPVTLTLHQSDTDTDELTLVVSNHTDSPLSWRSTTIPLAAFKLQLTDEKGNAVPTTHPATFHSPFAPPGNETTVAGGGVLGMVFNVESLLNGNARSSFGKLTLTATFEHGGQTYQSEPLELK